MRGGQDPRRRVAGNGGAWAAPPDGPPIVGSEAPGGVAGRTRRASRLQDEARSGLDGGAGKAAALMLVGRFRGPARLGLRAVHAARGRPVEAED